MMSDKKRKSNKDVQSIFNNFLRRKRLFVLEEMHKIELIAELEGLTVLSEFIENPKVLSKIISYYPSIKYVQGYVFNPGGVKCLKIVNDEILEEGNIIESKISDQFVDDKDRMKKINRKTVTEIILEVCEQRKIEQRNYHYKRIEGKDIKNKLSKNPDLKIERRDIGRGIHGQLNSDIYRLFEDMLVEVFNIPKEKKNEDSYSYLFNQNIGLNEKLSPETEKNFDKGIEYLEKIIFSEEFVKKEKNVAIIYEKIVSGSNSSEFKKYINLNNERFNRRMMSVMIGRGFKTTKPKN